MITKVNRRLEHEYLESEILVIGGGLGGAMAAIAAARQGRSVIVVEKAHVDRSGAAGTGNDHFGGVIIPGQSEWGVEDLVEDHVAMAFGFAHRDLIRNMAADSFSRVKDLEAMGVEFRKDADGKYHLIPQQHRVRSALYYVGRDIKPKLAQEMRRQRVKILNRTMITSLLIHQGRVTGAIGFNIRTGVLRLFRGGAVVIATGGTTRMFPNPTGYFFNTYYPPSCTGDGLALVLRAGGELANLEGVNRVRGPKNLERGGSGTYWPAKAVDARRRPLGFNFPGEAYYRWPAATARWTSENIKKGEIHLPIFRDTTVLSTEQLEHIEWGLRNEGGCNVLLWYMKERGLNFKEYLMEDDTYEPRISSGTGIFTNGECETSIPGLYAIGEAVAGVPWGAGSAALILGWRAGKNASRYIEEKGEPRSLAPDHIEAEKATLMAPLSEENGLPWIEVNRAIQQVMASYMGDLRTENGLKIGLLRLGEVKDEGKISVTRGEFRGLMRAHETYNLLEIAQGMLLAARERRCSSSYHLHFRADYPEVDPPEWHKWLIVKKENGILRTELRPID